MNKYQEALNKLKNLGDKDLYNEYYLEWTNVLQELVDKETPMKPKIEQQHDYVECHYVCSYEICLCPKCEVKISYADEYCSKCGQKLDWEEKK